MIPLELVCRFGKHLFKFMFVPVDPSTDVDSVTSLLLSTLCTSAPLCLMTSTLLNLLHQHPDCCLVSRFF